MSQLLSTSVDECNPCTTSTVIAGSKPHMQDKDPQDPGPIDEEGEAAYIWTYDASSKIPSKPNNSSIELDQNIIQLDSVFMPPKTTNEEKSNICSQLDSLVLEDVASSEILQNLEQSKSIILTKKVSNDEDPHDPGPIDEVGEAAYFWRYDSKLPPNLNNSFIGNNRDIIIEESVYKPTKSTHEVNSRICSQLNNLVLEDVAASETFRESEQTKSTMLKMKREDGTLPDTTVEFVSEDSERLYDLVSSYYPNKTPVPRSKRYKGVDFENLLLGKNLERPTPIERRAPPILGWFDIPEPLDELAGAKLTIKNYINTFHTLLWYEELQQKNDLLRYTLNQVSLTIDNDNRKLYRLKVPGLSENRPSLREGDDVFLVDRVGHKIYRAFIHKVCEKEVAISMNKAIRESPLEGLRFDVFFEESRTSYRRLHQGLVSFAKRNNPSENKMNDKQNQNPNSRIKDTLFPMTVDESKMPQAKIDIEGSLGSVVKWFNPNLNRFQRKAVISMLSNKCRPAPFIVFGPPGTGKTVTLTEAILQIHALDYKVLVCGNTNACVDNIAEKIYGSGVVDEKQIVRVASFSHKPVPSLEAITKDMNMISTPMYKKFKIVITTCNQCAALTVFGERFDYVFIDEAGHAVEPEAVLSMGLTNRDGCCILAGDPHQLGPVCMSQKAKALGLGLSLLQRLFLLPVYHKRDSKYDDCYITKLIISYRSDPNVMSISNKLFYDNELICKNRTPDYLLNRLKFRKSLIFHNVQGQDLRKHTSPSWYNPKEVKVCLEYVRRLYRIGIKPEQLGIITPYRLQIKELENKFRILKFEHCKIATMESFQGDEREIIIISTVRVNKENLVSDKQFNLGFLFNPQRFNVALSRAKWLVIVVGDMNVLQGDKFWSEYLKNAQIVTK